MTRIIYFPALYWYRKLASGEITVKEYGELTAEDLNSVVLEEDNES